MIKDLNQSIEIFRESFAEGYGFIETETQKVSVFKTSFADVNELKRYQKFQFGYNQEDLIYNVKIRFSENRGVHKGDLVKWKSREYVAITTAKEESIGKVSFLTFLITISNVQN